MFDLHSLRKSFNVTVLEHAALSEFTTFRLGGCCPSLIFCKTSRELQDVVNYFYAERNEEYIVIGEGSNLLVSDQGVKQHVIRYFSEKAYFFHCGDELAAEACSRLDDLALYCAQKGLLGLGFASGIPGTIGGAIAGNAGAFGRQISKVVKTVDVLDGSGQVRTVDAESCRFSYRDSRFKDSNEMIVRVVFKLQESSPEPLLKERKDLLAMRKEKHPDYKKVPCAGSFFKNIEATNPADRRQAAGWFLDQVGAKAMSVGGAGVFEKHANILIKKAKNCTACDVFVLSQRMEKAVLEKFGIVLDREVRMMGNFQ